MGKNKPNKIKIPKAASLDVEGKNSPIPKINSIAPTLKFTVNFGSPLGIK